MRKIVHDPLFILGLAVRLTLIVVVVPRAAAIWYAPFMDVTTRGLHLDPWSTFVAAGGDLASFPYGAMMWLVLAPAILLTRAVGVPVIYGYELTLFAVDLALLHLFGALFRDEKTPRRLLLAYWLSPIPIIATYWFGLNDLVPVVFLVLALLAISRVDAFRAGLFCAAAVSAKLSMVLTLPFFFIYLWRNRNMRVLLQPYLKGLALAGVILVGPFLFSPEGMRMLFTNPELQKIYNLALHLDPVISVYIVPLTYLLTLYAAWRVGRMNFNLFIALLGFSFLMIVLLTPASPGWFIWALPILVTCQMRDDPMAVVSAMLFSALYACSVLISGPGTEFSALAEYALAAARHRDFFSGQGASLLHTAMIATGIVLVARLWRETITRSAFFRATKRPLVIGIAGDSGAGKDTFAEALVGVLGPASVASIYGDDYHLWDRNKPMWRAMTHLNPIANDLERFARDVMALAGDRSIVTRHYDHKTGKTGRPFKVTSRDVVMASGLHALYLPMLRDVFDLSLFLDMDENLRRNLKLQRDVKVRGHTPEKVMSAIERRSDDAARFIAPQKAFADLVLAIQPLHPVEADDLDLPQPVRHRLVVRARSNLGEPALVRVLTGVCGLHVDLDLGDDAQTIKMAIEGEVDAEDIALAARLLLPDLMELMDIEPKWRDGSLGLMQLISMVYLGQAIKRRIL